MSDYINNEERRYKIQKKISYESKIEKEKKGIVKYAFTAAISGLVLIFAADKIDDANNLMNYLEYIIPAFGSYVITGASLASLIFSIKKKAKLEGKIEVIDEELKTFLENYTDDKEENRGMKL